MFLPMITACLIGISPPVCMHGLSVAQLAELSCQRESLPLLRERAMEVAENVWEVNDPKRVKILTRCVKF
jgi:hypothetical protein